MNKLISIILTVTVGIILTATMITPIIADMETDLTETYYNGPVALSQAYSSTPVDLSIEYTAGEDTFTVNGTEYDLGTYTRWGIFASDALSLMISTASSADTLLINQPSTANINATLSEGFTLTADDEGAFTLVYGSDDTTITGTYSWAVYLDEEGKYVWDAISSNEPRYIYSTTPVDCIVAFSFASGTNFLTYVDGVAEKNGTETTVEFTTTEVSETDGTISTLSEITFESSKTIAYGYVPLSVEYLSDSDGNIISLLGVIPVMLIIAFLGIVVRFVQKKDD